RARRRPLGSCSRGGRALSSGAPIVDHRQRGQAMSAKDNEKLGRKVYDLFNRRQLDAIAELIADNFELYNVPFDQSLSGKEGMRQYDQGWLNASPDGNCEITTVFAGEDACCVEFIGRGTNKGPLVTAAGTIKPTGKTVELQFCDIYHLEDGKFVSMHS